MKIPKYQPLKILTGDNCRSIKIPRRPECQFLVGHMDQLSFEQTLVNVDSVQVLRVSRWAQEVGKEQGEL